MLKIPKARMPILHHMSATPLQQGNKTVQNEADKSTEVGFRRWVITNSSGLKKYVLSQCKEAKNLDKMLHKLQTRITSLESNINDLMEMKNTAQELHEAYTSISSQIDQEEERISQIENHLAEKRHADKIKE
uniref:Uncharacterized protein n=1 Tax=Macaca fascicularis TaxID=9541 RepID=A0A7N9IHP0_MACFA